MREDFVETHVCKLRGILSSRVRPVLFDVKNVATAVTGVLIEGDKNLTAVQLSKMYTNVALDMHATLFNLHYSVNRADNYSQ